MKNKQKGPMGNQRLIFYERRLQSNQNYYFETQGEYMHTLVIKHKYRTK